jgi:hypothetical protein
LSHAFYRDIAGGSITVKNPAGDFFGGQGRIVFGRPHRRHLGNYGVFAFFSPVI